MSKIEGLSLYYTDEYFNSIRFEVDSAPFMIDPNIKAYIVVLYDEYGNHSLMVSTNLDNIKKLFDETDKKYPIHDGCKYFVNNSTEIYTLDEIVEFVKNYRIIKPEDIISEEMV